MNGYTVINETNLTIEEIGEFIWPLYWAQEVKCNKIESKVTFVNGEITPVTENIMKPKDVDRWIDTLVCATPLLGKLPKVTLFIDGKSHELRRVTQSKSGSSSRPTQSYSVAFSNDFFSLSFDLNLENRRYAGTVIKHKSGFSLMRALKNGA